MIKRCVAAADYTAFALDDLYQRLLADKALLVGCPTSDDAKLHREKLCRILAHSDIPSVDVAYIEVPCCLGPVRLVGCALEASGKRLPLSFTKIGIQGAACERQEQAA